MKKGSGSDPFADARDEADDADEASQSGDGSDTEPPRSDTEDGTTRGETADDGGQTANSEEQSAEAIVGEPPQDGATDSGVPWVYVRDTVKQDREMVQFYLRDFVLEAEDEFVDAVGDELGTDVSKTDVREAAYEAAMHNVDEVVDRLEAWGFESVD
ncbi:hypothetical protein [Natrinema salsiterrestre]|uniref:Uncharacterized protein n=1 Tax=Natrinema salsiterrestre TaxID=2950540 RepID=A0A9Q4Q3F0_9EURY|nr:hypothetical protein [Natrinema salsiterrestre]MDF9746178.1 hypothetical protein [Natrinema salsiterrestre]